MIKTKLKQTSFVLCTALIVSGCASSVMDPEQPVKTGKVDIADSYLKNNGPITVVENAELVDEGVSNSEFLRLNQRSNSGLKLEIDLSNKFGGEKKYQLSVNELPLNDFLHYVFGELLEVSYLIEPIVKSNDTPVTLELKEKISAQRLFQLTQQILNQNSVTVALNEDVFYVHQLAKSGTKSNIAFGFGRDEEDVPLVSSDIVQLIPLMFSTTSGLRQTISSLVNAKITIDNAQGLVSVQGKRQQVVRAQSLIKILDSEQFNNRAMALLSFSYIDSKTYIEKVSELLSVEGIGSKKSLSTLSSVQFVPIEHLGKVVVFATSNEILDRVEYWTQQLDKPATGSEQSFYTYHPKYARASDLGASLAPLIGGVSSSNKNNSTLNENRQNSNSNRQNSNANSTVQTIEGDNLRLVVDERSNSLIFYSTGKFYQELQPIIKKLDVMPKQVMLEVVIAEVKLTGSFAKGVNFALQSGPAGNQTESFAFNSEDGFSYSVVGLDGSININLNQKDGLVNVISRPTILVRDGVSATISVGDDIPTVGSTTTDPLNGERQTTTIQYRKTGVDLAVTPTINAQGTVIMTIEQNISNLSPDGLSVSGSPSVFERAISTEVVAADGQSVLLGGLISENKSTNASSIPVLGDIPVLGHLFRSDSDSTDKTELVVLVTPKIVSSSDEWQRIKQSFMQGLENIKF